MAVVNVDLSEYDAIRKRNSELEEQVKELKKLNESLKGGSKVILRKETTLLFNKHRAMWDYDDGDDEPQRKTIKSSESYINFEDVRLKVEQAMQDEVNRSIHDRNQERQAYSDKKNKLDNEYNGKKADLKKVYEKKAKDLEEDYSRKEIELRNKYSAMVANFESDKLRILNLLPNIRKLADELHYDLNKRFFKPKHAIELANSIIGLTLKKQ
ncbi:hypothetical protein [Segatella copri]|uniref:Uncharacterized protein n=1 Tax=Segatella copri TaxID=165179 RepID=A0AAW4MVW7_9BACT|nr:hypothetical protein [Segatella copri]MBV3386811.1 hypothetical protein [Segatella copri]MBV3394701.1 hypothetical protein [Segatella copri]MBV3405263.1 hypothetical protein [Segatella copri]